MCAALAALASGDALSAQARAVPEQSLVASRALSETDRCATGDDRARQRGLRPLAFVPDGRPGSFIQDPPILTSDYNETVVLREFMVLGDVPTARFLPSRENAEVETWTRSEVRTVGGRRVSIFNPSWSGSQIGAFIQNNPFGWDDGGISWGEFLPGDAVPGAGWAITLRIAPRSLPPVTVAQIAPDIQYSSHVVNIVLPDFGDGFLRDDFGFDQPRVSQRFFQEFEDTYDTLAIVPADGFTASYAAFHRNVKNDVRGIGLDVVDASASYGSVSRRLRSAEIYLGSSFTRAGTTTHELAHQWGSYFDWTRLSNVTRAGWSPESHDPLFTAGETVIGAVLRPWRRVETSPAGWQIGLTPPPAKLHPLTLYAMGLLPKESVPEIGLFDEQGQFNATAVTTPAVGQALTGGVTSATIFNVIGMYGERSGPVPSVWQRATIVVSRSLLSAREMDYWTYFAARSEDPARTGVVSYEGVGSFEAATSGRVDVKTDIRPLRAPAIVEPRPVDGLPFDRGDVRGLTFDQPIPSRYQAGQRNVWSGVINTLSQRGNVTAVTVRFVKFGGGASNIIRMDATVNEAQTFRVEKTFGTSERGLYLMQVFIFYPESGSQFSRTSLSPILVE